MSGRSCRTLWLVAGLLFALRAAAQAGPFDPAVAQKDLDLKSCGTFVNGETGAQDQEMMLNALGLSETRAPYHVWRAGSKAWDDLTQRVYQYRIAFNRPVAVGSMIYTTDQVAVLKADAPYPGDPANPDHWQKLGPPETPCWPRLLTFPVGFEARAFLFTDIRKHGQSFLTPLRLFKARLFSTTGQSYARASREYDAPDNFGGRLWAAADLVRARGAWVSAGKNSDGNIPVPPVSDVDPCWLALEWDEPVTINALYLQDNFTSIRFDTYRGPANLSPLIAVEREWKRIDPAQYQVSDRQGRWVAFKEPVRTRGLRIFTDKVLDQHGQALATARIGALLVLTDLGEAAAPAAALDRAESPFAIPLKLDQAGLLTLAIDGPDGGRVRNLMARREVQAGELSAAWDLRDESGNYVAPGSYRWKAITHPGLRLRYQFSVYPNVSQLHPENSAWLNGNTGPGGWLADHSPPYGVCAGGQWVFVGARVPEAGVGFAACDVSGRKLWGIHGFGPFSGARLMATDGKTVFVENMGIAYDDVGYEHVWAVDIGTQKTRDILSRKGDERRQIGITGIAARDGRLALAIHAAENWFANATGEAAVDIEQCVPRYREKRAPKRPYEIVPDPRNDFLRLFRLKGDPPGYAPGHGLTWLESTRGPGRRQYVVLAFSKPVSLGSCVFPVPQRAEYTVRLSVLKPDAPWPPDPEKQGQWTDFERQAQAPWDIAIAPKNCSTRALRITFLKGGADEIASELDDLAEKDSGLDLRGDQPEGGAADRGAWVGRIEGMKLLRRRYVNLYPTAKVSVSSGSVTRDGVWEAKRTEPLSREKPEIFMMTWPAPQKVRGLAVKEIDCKLAEVDVWTGPDAAPADLRSDENWETVGQYVPRRRMNHSGFGGHNADALYMDDTVDFGRTVSTRAIRIRVVEQWLVPTREGSCAKDGLGIDPARCRLFGVAPLEYIGGEPPVDPLMCERVELYAVGEKDAKLEKEIPFARAGQIAFGPDGSLFGLSAGKVVRIDLDGGKHRPIIEDLEKPLSLALDPSGCFYVFDDAPARKTVRVYDAAGKLVREIGKPGGYRVGPWDPYRLQSISALAVDAEGKLWAVDQTYWPKRVSVWKTDGTFLREYLGPTQYGGAGVLDPWDKRRLCYGPLEFELDWDKGTSRLKSLTWDPADGWSAGERPIHIGERIYMVNDIDTPGNTMKVGIVYLYENQRCRQTAAMGWASAWNQLKTPDIRKKLGRKTLPELQFLWTDRNEDGQVQFEEIVFEPRSMGDLTRFNDDLAIQAGPWRYTVREFLPRGTPVYERHKLPLPPPSREATGEFFKLDNGTFYEMGGGRGSPERGWSADGKLLWTYPNDGRSVGPNRTAGPYRPDQVVCQFGVVGRETAAGGDLGEFFVLHNNIGQWNLWTADGLLASRIFRDNRDPKAVFWQMPEHDRGMVMDNISLLEEHFHGWFCRTREDGKYYAIAGKNHASIVEVQGLDEFKRLSGTIQVAPEDLARVGAWERRMARQSLRERPPVLDCFRTPGPIGIDGNLADWPQVPAASIGGDIELRCCYDDQALYLAYTVMGRGPLRNTGNRWDHYFKTGAALDFLIGTDEGAAADRQAPVAGDKRLLMTIAGTRPEAILYDMVVPGTPPDKKWRAASPVAQIEIDRVSRIDGFKLGYAPIWFDPKERTGLRGYVCEVLIPLSELGLKVRPGLRLKADWGVLEGGPEGNATVRRVYWANRLGQTVADVPSEARVQPDLWGWIRFLGDPKTPFISDKPGFRTKEEEEADKFLQELDE